MAKFHVIYTFTLEGRKLFVLAGYIVEGDIVAGQILRVPFNSQLSMTAPIHAIEYARRSPDREDVCLCISYDDQDDLAVWQGLNIYDETFEIVGA